MAFFYHLHKIIQTLHCVLDSAFAKLQHSLDVFRDNVDFKIEGVRGFEAREIGQFPSFRNYRYVEIIVAKGRDREADAVHGNRSLVDKILCDLRRKSDSNCPKLAFLHGRKKSPAAVDMALYIMTAHMGQWCYRSFKIDACTGVEVADRRAMNGFGRNIGRERGRGHVESRQTNAVDSDRVTVSEIGGYVVSTYLQSHPR